MLQLENLQHRFGAHLVLDIPAWQVGAGETRLIVGRSGAGKSTLLSILAGLLVPTQGTVRLDGQALSTLSETARDRLRGQRIGILTQRIHFLGGLSVGENLLLAQQSAGHAPDASRVAELLGSLGIVPHARPRTLSQGQAQRAALARALINRPALLLADEPTANLDDDAAANVLALMQRTAQEAGSTLLVATHDARAKAALGEEGALRLSPPAVSPENMQAGNAHGKGVSSPSSVDGKKQYGEKP
jgi:putative ABC transport system ATP-binding protein